MLEHFRTYITAHGNFTEEEIQHISSLAVVKKVRRRQLLLHEGEVCRHKIFVCKGLLRVYRRNDKGAEYVMRFAPENTWAIDAESYHNQTPSKYHIDALEDAAVIMWSRENADELLAAIPAFRSFSEKLRASTLDASQERILMNISYTAEEKYQEFIASFPDVFRRVPLHMVASYLGVSRETLSRVRHAQLKRHLSSN